MPKGLTFLLGDQVLVPTPVSALAVRVTLPAAIPDGTYTLRVATGKRASKTLFSQSITITAPKPLPTNGKIVFQSSPQSNWDIYTMDADGSNVTRLTDDPATDGDAVFSPDGSKIAFWSGRDGWAEIYIMNADGSNVTRLTHNEEADSRPVFSPDGSKVAFVASRRRNRFNNREIYVMNVDGSNQINLSNPSASTTQRISDTRPVFSPDSSKIAFESYPDTNSEICTVNVDGTNLTNLTNSSLDDYDPVFSPDGTKIVFSSYGMFNAEDTYGSFELFIMNVDGSAVKQLTSNSGLAEMPVFTRDGSQIVFVSYRGGGDIYIMNADGSNQTNITNDGAKVSYPVLSPDGRKLVFISFRDKPYGYWGEIYTMILDGSDKTRLTSGDTAKGWPRWGAGPVSTVGAHP
jgi:Tol biopolymer transport system component